MKIFDNITWISKGMYEPYLLHPKHYKPFSKHLYWWTPSLIDSTIDIFDFINKNDFLKDDSYLVVDFSPDPLYQSYIENTFLKSILTYFSENHISFDKLIVLSPTPTFLYTKTSFKYTHMFCNSLFDPTQKTYFQKPFNVSDERTIEKTFFTLMRKDTIPRCILNYLLHKKGVHEHGFVSHNRVKINNLSDSEILSYVTKYTKINDFIEYGLKVHKIDADSIKSFNSFEFEHEMQHINPSFSKELSEKSLVEIIVETQNLDQLFITEKTLKAFLCKNIFLIFNTPRSLEFLRGLGFKTFSPFIDESYDLIEDTYARANAIVDEIKKLSLLSQHDQYILLENCAEIVYYNYNHFLYSDWHFNLHNRIEKHITKRNT